ncbi:MAG: DUF1844 domain-containing protein [Armatimonadota bacterium]
MPDQETEGFQVVDKRRLITGEESSSEAPGEKDSETGQAEAASVSGAGAQTAQDQTVRETGEQMSAEVPDLLAYMLSLLGAAAWQWMGLIANPVTRKAEVDLNQARLAIDTFEDIARRLYPYLDEETNRQIRQSLTDLRVNFLERSKSGGQS